MRRIGLLLTIALTLCGCQNKNSERMTQEIEDFMIIGIAIETSNLNGQAEQDLGALWGRFFSKGISALVPHKSTEDIYSLFTDYESDYRGNYTAILGHKVSSLDSIPEGLIGRRFTGGTYTTFKAKGEMPQAIVNTWKEIWSQDEQLQRRYTVDFEVYGAKSQQGKQSEVDIFIAVP